MSNNPLGRVSGYPTSYAPEVLCPIPRLDSRARLELDGALPFDGEDIWNAYELTWLDETGKPLVATVTLRIPASSVNIVESKSLKLYLNSFAMSRYDTADALLNVIRQDISSVVKMSVVADLTTAAESVTASIATFPGVCIDDNSGDFSASDVDPRVLKSNGDNVVDESLHSHLLRSCCPVTDQPDLGSALVRYRGPQIDRTGLLQYIVSFRQHNDFHEACVERMFVDIMRRCRSETLSVTARYTRRGGIDINPFRSNVEKSGVNTRLWRQ